MRKLYNEFFYIPKFGKIREKVMLAHVTLTVIIMIGCLAAMSLTAYAYFSYNVTSGTNVISSARFEADVSVRITDENGETVPVNQADSKTHTAVLSAGTTYYVTLKESGNSTAKTGFCIVTAAGCSDTYHTQQLGEDETVVGGKTDSITFSLEVTADTTVKFLSHWGTSSCYDAYSKGEGNRLYITSGKPISMKITKTAAVVPSGVIHTVVYGENLTWIANRYNTTVEQIMFLNGLENADSIQEGQRLMIPSGNVPAESATP